MIEGEIVSTIRELANPGVGKRRIARQVGVSINTVRRYVRGALVPGVQRRPAAQRLTTAVERLVNSDQERMVLLTRQRPGVAHQSG